MQLAENIPFMQSLMKFTGKSLGTYPFCPSGLLHYLLFSLPFVMVFSVDFMNHRRTEGNCMLQLPGGR